MCIIIIIGLICRTNSSHNCLLARC